MADQSSQQKNIYIMLNQIYYYLSLSCFFLKNMEKKSWI